MTKSYNDCGKVKINTNPCQRVKYGNPCTTCGTVGSADYCDNTCYSRTSTVQLNDLSLTQVVSQIGNLELSSVPPEIITGDYTLTSSNLNSYNDTLLINKAGVYSIYFSLKYSFEFGNTAVPGDLYPIIFSVVDGNYNQIIQEVSSVIVPNSTSAYSQVTNVVQGSILVDLDSTEIPYSLNVVLESFNFTVAVNEELIVQNLVLTVERIG